MNETTGSSTGDTELIYLDECWDMKGSAQEPKPSPLRLPLHRVSDLDTGEDQ